MSFSDGLLGCVVPTVILLNPTNNWIAVVSGSQSVPSSFTFQCVAVFFIKHVSPGVKSVLGLFPDVSYVECAANFGFY